MNPREFQNCAVELLKNAAASYSRSAVSRAYYAAFHVARSYLLQGGFHIAKSDSAHTMVARFLSWSDDAALLRVTSQLGDLRSARNEADYDLDKVRLENAKTAEGWIATAQTCIDSLDAAFNGVDGTLIIDAIRANQKKVMG